MQRGLQQARNELRGVTVPTVVGMDHVSLHVAPLQSSGLDFRPERVAEADHRETVVLPDLAMPLLGVAAVLVHGEQQHHGGLIRRLEDLPDQSFERFGATLLVGVVDRVLDDDEIWSLP